MEAKFHKKYLAGHHGARYNSSAWNMTQEDQQFKKKKKVLGTEAHACKLLELRQDDP